MEIHFREELT